MFNRIELKARGKAAFMANYWKCVLAALLISLLTAAGTYSGGSSYNLNANSQYSFSNQGGVVHLDGSSSFLPSAFITFLIIVVIISIVLNFFVFNVIEVGGDSFFIKNSHGENPSIGELFSYFSSGNYLNIVKIMFFRDLYQALWTLCLIIPGIIKSYEYQMIPYLLSQNPSLSQKEVFEKSSQMINGYKMDTFILDLSFIGWDLLSLFTFGFLEIFYVSPYKEAVNAELYNFLSGPVEKETVNPDVIDTDYTQNNF